MSKHQEQDRHVNITRLKRPREFEHDDDEDDDTLSDDESVDAYKDWLQAKGPDTGTCHYHYRNHMYL